MTRRLAQAAATVLVATAIFFAMMYVLPGDPIRAIFGFRPPSPDVLRGLRESYGLDESYAVQYLRYLGRLLHGDLGVSFYGRSVSGILAPAVPRTLVLLGAVLTLEAAFVAVAVTIRARRGVGLAHRLSRWSTLLLVGIPVLVLAHLLQQVLGVHLGWLPRWVDFAGQDDWTSWVLPVVTLAAWFGAVLTRQTHDALERELRQPHVRTATAKGLTPARTILVHGLRPAAAPTIHLAGAQVGELLAALVIVESIFQVGGVGSVLYTAIQRHDQAVVVGSATAILIVVVIATAVVDVVAAALDPRQRHR